MEITTREQLAGWLEHEGWFNDGRLYSYRPEPASPPPREVQLEIGYWVGGGLDPGDVMTFRVFQLTARGVTHFSIGPPGHNPNHWSEGAELVGENLGFTIDTPGLLRLSFTALYVVQLPNRGVVVEPWVSDNEFAVLATEGQLPSAEDWIRTMNAGGLDAKWNFCGDDESQAHDPEPFRYEGWCLQLRESGRLEESLFRAIDPHDRSGYSMSIQRRGSSGRLWTLVKQAAVAEPSTLVRAGNVEFNAAEWGRYLEDGTLPDQPRGWSKSRGGPPG